MRPALCWEITQRVVAVLTDVSGQPKFLTLGYAADRLSETSVRMATIRRVISQKSADLKHYRYLLLVRCGVLLTVY